MCHHQAKWDQPPLVPPVDKEVAKYMYGGWGKIREGVGWRKGGEGERKRTGGEGEGRDVLGWQVRPNEVREEERSEPKGT